MFEPDEDFLGSVASPVRSPVRQPLNPLANFVSPSRKLWQAQRADRQDVLEKEADVGGEAAEAEKAAGQDDDQNEEDGPSQGAFEEDDDFFGGARSATASASQSALLRRMAEEGPAKDLPPAPLLELELDEGFADLDEAERPSPPKKRAVAAEDEMEVEDAAAKTAQVNGHPAAAAEPAAPTPAFEINEDFDIPTSDLISRPTSQPQAPEARLDATRPCQAPPDRRPADGATGVDLNARASTSTGRPRWITAAPIRATTFGGKAVHFTKRRRIGSEGPMKEETNGFRDLFGASASSIHLMVSEARRRIREDVQRRAVSTEKANVAKGKNKADADANGVLWTDKYRPTKFVELLGDERVFRTAMSWLKEWDNCVFKSSASAASRKRAAKKRSQGAAFGSSFKSGPFAPKGAAPSTSGDSAVQALLDPLGRPNEKILLLCGPPGLGKTTMAHVLASQAGYAVLEVNASDDRTAKVVTERIRGAIETRTLDKGAKKGGGMTLGDNRPTCVIVDEIDGAGGGSEGGFVRALAKMVIEGSVVKKSKGKGKKAAEIKPLVRPIICICNDLYAPVLRPLRPLARVIRFAAPTNAMLVKRLRTICNTERLKADLKNLNLLIEMSAGDLRNCLNSLQFIKRQGNRVDEDAVKSASVGSKDTGTSAQAALSALFRPPKAKKASQVNEGLYLDRLSRDLSTCGEYERLAQGCFEAYPAAKQQAALWDAYEAAHDWLNFYDSLDRRIRQNQTYELLGYVPYSLVPFHPLFANLANKAPEYPRVEYETYLKRTAHQEITDTFRYGLPPVIRDIFTTQNIICELMPLLMRILSPDLRPVNSQLIRREEREVLMNLVGQMLSMKLNFVQEKSEDGQLTYKLDPPIDVFVHYEGKRAADIPASRYGTRHLVSKEMEAEIIKRAEGTPADQPRGVESIIAAYKTKPSETQVAVQEAAAVDFFGRKIALEKVARAGGAIVTAKKALPVLFKYHEGFSTAVKKPIKMRELLSR